MTIQIFFTNLLSMAAMASVVVLIVLLLRPLLKKAPRKLIYGLWLIVAIRLVIPDMVSSDFSLFNAVNMVTVSALHTDNTYKSEDFTNNTASGNMSSDMIPTTPNKSEATTDVHYTKNPSDTILSYNSSYFEASVFDYDFKLPTQCITLWLVGMGVFFIYFIISYVLLARRVRYATLVFDADKNIKAYYCENISTPFVFGTLRPRIYIPYGIKDENLDLILQHEQYHIRKGDHLTRIFAFLLLAVYWFCPFVWLAYYLSQKDMELRCDEAILKNASIDERKSYSNALLAFAGNNRKYLLSPVAFSENSTKERIKLSLKAHKVSAITTAVAFVAVIVIAITCLTDDNSKDYNIPYGLYLGDDLYYISLKADGISKSNYALSRADIYYDYTIEDNVIYVHSEDEPMEIEVKNKSTLILDKKEYILDHTYDEKDWYLSDSEKNWYVSNTYIPETEEDADASSSNTTNLQYGFFATQDDLGLTLELTKDSLIYHGSRWAERSPIEYEYTITDNVIYAANDLGEIFEIEIVNTLHLKYNGQLYTYTPDAGIDVISYINTLTDEDISSAIEAARTYYSSKFFIERIDSIKLCENQNRWLEAIKSYNHEPGALIVIETEAVSGGYIYPSTRCMYLYRSPETNNQWTFIDEGK